MKKICSHAQHAPPCRAIPSGAALGGRLVKNPDAKKQEWLKFRLQASNGFTGLPNRLLDSKPFAMLTTGAEVKCLNWFWQEAKYEKKKRKTIGNGGWPQLCR